MDQSLLSMQYILSMTINIVKQRNTDMAVSVNITKASHAYRKLNGVFAVYKSSGISVDALLNSVKARLLTDITNLEPDPQKQFVKYLPFNKLTNNQQQEFIENPYFATMVDTFKENNTLVPVNQLDWFHHPMVAGPQYTRNDFNITSSHFLDVKACGVQVLGLQEKGEQLCNKIVSAQLPNTYQARGHLGLSTSSHTGDTKIIEKSTWDHVTAEKISKVLTMMEGVHRNACMKASGYDLSSQIAYKMASKGLLKPHGINEPVILGITLSEFKPPEFSIDITVINESCQYLRKVIHEIGIDLKTSAICTQLQRTCQAVFTVENKNTLLPTQINVQSLANSMDNARFLLLKQVLSPKKHFQTRNIVITKDKNDFKNQDSEILSEPNLPETDQDINVTSELV